MILLLVTSPMLGLLFGSFEWYVVQFSIQIRDDVFDNYLVHNRHNLLFYNSILYVLSWNHQQQLCFPITWMIRLN